MPRKVAKNNDYRGIPAASSVPFKRFLIRGYLCESYACFKWFPINSNY